MTAPGRYAANDSSFARSAGGAAARGGVLIAIAVLIGLVLLWQGFDGGNESAAVPPDVEAGADGNGGTATDDGTADNGEETAENGDETGNGDEADNGDEPIDDVGTVPEDTTSPVAVDPPESVKVAVLNGRGEAGLGTARAEVLAAAGYVAVGANGASFENELSRVYYTLGYEDEAKVVAEALNGGSSVLDEAPADPLALVAESFREAVTDFDIYVMLGTDEVLG